MAKADRFTAETQLAAKREARLKEHEGMQDPNVDHGIRQDKFVGGDGGMSERTVQRTLDWLEH
eukprot:13970701-Alexandrium_andersonii.AAC.1